MSDALQQAVDLLGEHYDAVQVLVTWSDAGITKSRHLGSGNWYARQGMAHDFVKSDDSAELAKEIGKVINPPEST